MDDSLIRAKSQAVRQTSQYTGQCDPVYGPDACTCVHPAVQISAVSLPQFGLTTLHCFETLILSD
jgi:hypothetical protein